MIHTALHRDPAPIKPRLDNLPCLIHYPKLGLVVLVTYPLHFKSDPAAPKDIEPYEIETTPLTGVVIHPGRTPWEAGALANNWDPDRSQFVLFTGSFILENAS